MFIIIEPVDGAGGEHLLVGVTPVVLYGLHHATMLAAHNRVNIYDTRCRRKLLLVLSVAFVAGTITVNTLHSRDVFSK